MTLVTIGLPVRNGAAVIAATVRGVLAQEHPDLELLITDNASCDGTEEICRDLAAGDPRVRYHRQPANIGLLNNFVWAMDNARGRYFKWIGDDDRMEPTYLTRCLQPLAADDRIVLVTTQQAFIGPDGVSRTAPYRGDALGSDRPVDRFREMLRLLNQDHLLLDPMYGLIRREPIAAITRRNMLREDEVFAARMALAGPWAHVPELLASRGWAPHRAAALARRLDVPPWHARVQNVLQCRELVRHLREAPLSDDDRRLAYGEVVRLYLRRHLRTAARRGRRLAELGTPRTAGTAARPTASTH